MEYVNKSGVVALKGLHHTGRLDDDGFPEIGWYGVRVETMTGKAILLAMLDAISFNDLEKQEQGVIMTMITGGMKPFQKTIARRIIAGYRRGRR